MNTLRFVRTAGVDKGRCWPMQEPMYQRMNRRKVGHLYCDTTKIEQNKKGDQTEFIFNRATSSEFVSSSIPSWRILTAHAQPFRGARDLAFCLKVPLDSLLVRASSGGSGETARMRRLTWTFAARIGHKYQIRLTRPNQYLLSKKYSCALNKPPVH